MRLSSIAAQTAGVLLAAGPPVFAQCSMCRTAAAAQGPEGAHALNVAIAILLVPAVTLFSGLFLLAFRSERPARTGEREGRPPEL
ncbi:MAG TPA: hypothetical protein VN442_23560 [Bryobacteraceae bacterium]|nr:hypothetical protein [Bryobacteraceae bacterium]